MYYLLVKQKLNNGNVKRNITTVVNKESFADLKDEFSTANPPVVTMDKDTFNKILKNGYPTKEAVENDKKMKQALKDFIGPTFQTECSIIDENELKTLYEKLAS